MDEIERGPRDDVPPAAPERPAGEQGGGEGGTGEAGPQAWRGDRDGGRRRRGRRGRGGRAPTGPTPPYRPPQAAPEEDEGSAQARELAAYERRQRQTQQRGSWRGPRQWGGGQPRPAYQGGAPRPFVGRPSGGVRGGGRPQRYQEMIRRATAGPRVAPPEEAGEPIAGPHAVLEALRAGRPLRRIYVAQERGVRAGASSDVIREAQERRVQVLFVDRMDVQRLSPGVEHQGVVAIAEGRQGVEIDELLLHLDTLTEPPLVLLIDSLQDPQNFGVLLRSAEGAGVDGVVIPRHRQVGLTPAVSRTSAGATEHLLIADVANLRQAIDALKERGIWVVGTDDSGELEWDAVDYRGATAIVVGGEGEGIRRLVLEGCDEVVRIPMQGQVSSLNAAAAGTVILFEALRQRMRDAPPAVSEGVPGPRAEERASDDEEAADEAEPESGVDTDAADELPPTPEAPGAAPEEKPTGAAKRAAPRSARSTVKKSATKRTTKKKTDGA
ncbi:MAG: 23S rRNA (guanosine(2251)-2'-O)-methyltransferase RlmB [Chloroflexota bacterium]|nr:23S rRNA (guanosine(2251)-2'-O)-methyltransferase RlmB [Chloroflexota bacterium]